jgi:hypothetical protein
VPWTIPKRLDPEAVEAQARTYRDSARFMDIKYAQFDGSRLGAEGRLLGFLGRCQESGTRIKLQANYYFPDDPKQSPSSSVSSGWEVFRSHLTSYLLAIYSRDILSYDRHHVRDQIIKEQLAQLERSSGMIGTGKEAAGLLSGDPEWIFPEHTGLHSEDIYVVQDELRVMIARRLGFRFSADEAQCLAPLTVFLKESLDNVRDHALEFESDGVNRTAIAFFQLRRVNLSQEFESMLRANRDGSGLSEYLSRLQLRASVERLPLDKSRFIEVTIADAGPGIAGRFHGSTRIYQDTESHAVEAEHLLNAFRDGQTTKPPSASKDGEGLGRVLEQVHALNGCLVIRSGRHAITHHFLKPDGNRLDVDFQSPLNPSSIERASYLAGTSVTLLLPIGLTRG